MGESSVPDDKDDDLSAMHVNISDLRMGSDLTSAEQIEEASAEMDKLGIDLPIREGLGVDEKANLSEDEPEDHDACKKSAETTTADDETSEEESELNGRRRPRYGEGWWGRGPTIQPHRKGHVKQFIDGAGFPSPGRWPLNRRRLPDDHIAKKLKDIVMKGLLDSVDHLPGRSIKTAVAKLASGGCECSPFPADILKRTREDIRIALMKPGFGDGLP